MSKHKYDDLYIEVSEHRRLYLHGKEPQLVREACVQRWGNGKMLTVAVYSSISEASVFRLVALQDKFAAQRQAEKSEVTEVKDEIPF
jgi:hypothetical protein